MAERPSERAIVFCVGAVQFVNILDFMIVMPLGPDFAKDLGIPLSHLGYVASAYTAAACASGLAGALFLDRFDRRKALAVSMVGLVLGTLGGAFARGLGTLMLARAVAGAFGGPATSLSYSIIADVIPPERRGKAMGAVMGALSLASVLGVPFGLELARRGSWKVPFIVVALMGVVLGATTYVMLPPMTGHLARARGRSFLRDVRAMARADLALSLMMTFIVNAANFILIPNLSAYTLGNLQYPRKYLGVLYLVGGSVSFFVNRVTGPLVDRFGSARVGTVGALGVTVVVFAGMVQFPPLVPVMAIFVGFFVATAIRNVSYNTLTSKVPHADERARFGSIQSAVQHLASAIGPLVAARMLTEEAGMLVGIPRVATISIVLGFFIVPMLFIVESRVARQASSES